MRVLIIEDSRELAGLIGQALKRAGMDVDIVGLADEARLAVRAVQYSAIVLDLGLPDDDGLAVLDQLKRRHDPTPVLILSSRSALGDRVNGLDRGASDYMVKPFATAELIARLRALLQRPPEVPSPVFAMGNVAFEARSRRAVVNGSAFTIPAREGELLEVFLKRGGRVLAHDVLDAVVFGGRHDSSSNAVEVYVHRLRRLLAEAGADVEIHTIRGVGYLMKPAIAARATAQA
ncbi:MAG: response regulator transcription factor [Reyranella sp.]|uniref:response regulator n=1 Tax=Reyranella sp. TaxID=1929291 RepID=UPI0012065262|nr:response regulator transcription factor [Reyranella sp.]TAJ92907.1 MAG: response regulator transcription factor [Reyranella sp.]TBR25850.1 MAG: response regulator transcription factor [Reyranella sp.]